ncbi:hypothetical protein OKA05_08540 [Luteolibacter arcticus]|uniref:Peptidase C14 n=1 Tax=Luteolibacter arcticus TaxID=1581411 RepID=A0ABT3GG53_9BACT|nr:hypothetical protein [Luteolibacter arcticus]MCW1922600.1 hypothetical protein [Luteolibacter arcticus]
MKTLLLLYLLIATAPLLRAEEKRALLIVIGEPGNALYQEEFQRQAKVWQDLAAKAKMDADTIGLGDEPSDGDRPGLEKAIADMPKNDGDLWLVWIGHGTFDGRAAKFNLRGPDIEATAVAELLKPFQQRLIVLNLFSASGPFVAPLSGKNRVVVSASRGGEKNYSRLGEKLANSLGSADADLDLDGSLSLLEAILHASAAAKAFYDDAQRVVAEHAVIDDNGDGRGTGTDKFKGLRADGAAPDGALSREIYFLGDSADPLTPEAREERTKLESEIEALRQRKKDVAEDDYYAELEPLMRRMAKLYGK